MTAAETAPPADGLLPVLERLRRRHRLRGAIEALLWGVAAALLVMVLDRSLGLPPGWPWLAPVAILLSGLAIAWVGTPSVAGVAREADRVLLLQERLASAVDVLRRWSRDSGPVVRALLRDAAARAGAIDATALVPLWTRRVRVAAAVSAMLLVAVFVAHPPAPVERVATPAVEEPASAGGASVEDVQMMAEFAEEAARMRDEDTLYAIARDLEALAAEARTGLSQQDFESRLAAITGDAALAFGDQPPVWLPREPGNLAELSAALASYQALLAEQRRANEALAAHNVEAFQRFWDEQQAASAAAEAARLSEAPGLDLGGAGMDGMLPDDLGAVAPEGGEPGIGGAVPIGAATESQGGGGEAAGAGSEAVESAEPFVEIAATPLAEMTLPVADIDTGRRIEVIAPVEPGAEAGLRASGSVPAGGSRGEALAADRDAVGAAERKVVARYFARSGATVER